MDGFGYFFEPLPDKRLIEKSKQVKGGKKSKQRCTIDFFVNAVREKVEEPVFTWKSGIPRCFRGLRDPSRPANVHYLSNPKSCLTSEVVLAALKWFKRNLLSSKKGNFVPG